MHSIFEQKTRVAIPIVDLLGVVTELSETTVIEQELV